MSPDARAVRVFRPWRRSRAARVRVGPRPVGRRGLVLLGVAVMVAAGTARAGGEERNWFDDPFFRISTSLADCPEPAGPYVTEAEMRGQSHHRAEKGTSCWLAGQCDRPSSYAYDADIAVALRTALQEREPLPESALWVMVRARIVYVEGCARTRSTAAAVEALARSLPDVQQVVTNVRVDPRSPVPYRRRTAP